MARLGYVWIGFLAVAFLTGCAASSQKLELFPDKVGKALEGIARIEQTQAAMALKVEKIETTVDVSAIKIEKTVSSVNDPWPWLLTGLGLVLICLGGTVSLIYLRYWVRKHDYLNQKPKWEKERKFKFDCDAPGCNEHFEGDGQFEEVWSKAKNRGWKARWEGKAGRVGIWKHFCSKHA